MIRSNPPKKRIFYKKNGKYLLTHRTISPKLRALEKGQ
jgi:hypothetical protein